MENPAYRQAGSHGNMHTGRISTAGTREWVNEIETSTRLKTKDKTEIKSEAAEFETQLAVQVVKQTIAEILALVTRRNSC